MGVTIKSFMCIEIKSVLFPQAGGIGFVVFHHRQQQQHFGAYSLLPQFKWI